MSGGYYHELHGMGAAAAASGFMNPAGMFGGSAAAAGGMSHPSALNLSHPPALTHGQFS